MLKLKLFTIVSASIMMAATTLAQPPGLKKDKKVTERAPIDPENIVITSDTLTISYDTSKVRFILYCTDCTEPDTYLYFRDGYMITKIWKSKNPNQKPIGMPFYFYKDWSTVKPEDAFDVREYRWKK